MLTSICATGPVALHLGVCAAALGRHESARANFDRAVEMCDRLGVPVFGNRLRASCPARISALELRAALTE